MAWHYKQNLNPKHYFLCPIGDLLKADLPDELYNLDILDGSPPCSTFSMVGSREKGWGKEKFFREGQTRQVLSDLFFDYLNLVDRLKPRVAIAENVKGMILGNARGYAKLVISRFREIGYKVQLFLLNAADCGVPQARERVFFVALREDLPGERLVLSPAHRWISTGEATIDLQELTEAEKLETQAPPSYVIGWRHTKEGGSLSDGKVKAGLKAGGFYSRRVNSRSVVNALTSQDQHYLHWGSPRLLTFREWKRLGSFPDDYKAKTDKLGKYMIGMSVPPRMTEFVAREVIKQWLTHAR